jgi:hypothetical protein
MVFNQFIKENIKGTPSLTAAIFGFSIICWILEVIPYWI